MPDGGAAGNGAARRDRQWPIMHVARPFPYGQCIELLSLLIAQAHHILLYGDVSCGHEPPPSFTRGDIDSEIVITVYDAGD